MSSASRVLLAFTAPVALLGVIAASVWVSASTSDRSYGPMLRVPAPSSASTSSDLLDAPPLNIIEKLSPMQAELRNALIPFTQVSPLSPARYSLSGAEGEFAAALDCLTSAVYYEAGREPLVGQQAVAQVILNRRASASFPKTVCGVVQQGAPRPGCQFTFECDGSLARRPDPSSWASARTVAQAALNGFTLNTVGAATHYHADYVVPVWATTMMKLVKLGHHIFYRWPGARLAAEPLSAAPPDATIAAEIPTSASPVESADASPLKPVTSIAPTATSPAPSAEPPPAAPTIGPRLFSNDPAPPVTAPRPSSAPPRRAVPEQTLRGGGPF